MSSESEALADRVDKALNCNVPNRHSLFQLKYFVIGKEPTHQRRLWRCLEELKSRKEGLDALKLQIEDTRDNIQLTEIELEKLKYNCGVREDKWSEQEYDINVRKIGRNKQALSHGLTKLEKLASEQEEEMSFFVSAFETLSKTNKLKPFDDFESQLEYFNERYAQMLNMRVLLNLPLDIDSISSILALPDSAVKKQVETLLENQHRHLKSLKDRSTCEKKDIAP